MKLSSRPVRAAFTLIELLVVIAIIAILAAMLLPALARSKQKAHGILCMNNGKQMMVAWKMYSIDSNGFLPPNEDDSGAPPGHVWSVGHAGQLPSGTNTTLLTNPNNNLLANYTGGNVKIYKCPADPGASGLGTSRSFAVRSFAMNQAVGTVCPSFKAGGGHGGIPRLATDGPWLDGAHGHKSGSPFRTFGKDSDFVRAATTWVFIDEHHESINDAGFGHPGPSTVASRWVDFPGIYHGKAGGLSFADGHSEIRKWKGLSYPATGTPPNGVGAVGSANRNDWQWLAENTSQRAR